MDRLKSYLVLMSIASLVVALDQWTKYLVRTRLAFGEVWAPWEGLASFIRIVHWNNTGSAFGLFPSAGSVFTVVAVVVILAVLYYFPRVPGDQIPLRLALSLQFGGAIGNLLDRLAYGTVTDFVAVGNFPVFNVADSSISIGVAALIIAMLLESRWSDQGGETETDPPPDDGDATPTKAEETVG